MIITNKTKLKKKTSPNSPNDNFMAVIALKLFTLLCVKKQLAVIALKLLALLCVKKQLPEIVIYIKKTQSNPVISNTGYDEYMTNIHRMFVQSALWHYRFSAYKKYT